MHGPDSFGEASDREKVSERFELRSDFDDQHSGITDDALDSLIDPNKLTFGRGRDQIPAEPEMIKRAGRTAQILLQDRGIKITKPLRQKIITY